MIASAIVGLVDQAIDKIWPDAEASAERQAEKTRLKMALRQQLIENEHELRQAAAGIVKAEVSGTGIKAWWRPVTALTLVALVVARWLGVTAPGIDAQLEIELMELIKIMIGGYVGSRGVEKIAPSIAEAIKHRKGGKSDG